MNGYKGRPAVTGSALAVILLLVSTIGCVAEPKHHLRSPRVLNGPGMLWQTPKTQVQHPRCFHGYQQTAWHTLDSFGAIPNPQWCGTDHTAANHVLAEATIPDNTYGTSAENLMPTDSFRTQEHGSLRSLLNGDLRLSEPWIESDLAGRSDDPVGF